MADIFAFKPTPLVRVGIAHITIGACVQATVDCVGGTIGGVASYNCNRPGYLQGHVDLDLTADTGEGLGKHDAGSSCHHTGI